MRGLKRLLTSVTLALTAATGLAEAPADAATRTTVAAKRVVAHRTLVRRAAVRRIKRVGRRVRRVPPAAAVLAPAPPATPVVYQAPIVPLPAPAAPVAVESYRWLDDADAMEAAVGERAPDLRFTDGGAERWAWRLGNGGLIVAAPVDGYDTRFFYYYPDMTAPFLVRDRDYSYAYQYGRMVAAFDATGQLLPAGVAETREGPALAMFAAGRRLWDRLDDGGSWRPAIGWSVAIDFGIGRARWRDNDGWRIYRQRTGRTRDARRGQDRRHASGGPAGEAARADRHHRGGGRADRALGEGVPRDRPVRGPAAVPTQVSGARVGRGIANPDFDLPLAAEDSVRVDADRPGGRPRRGPDGAVRPPMPAAPVAGGPDAPAGDARVEPRPDRPANGDRPRRDAGIAVEPMPAVRDVEAPPETRPEPQPQPQPEQRATPEPEPAAPAARAPEPPPPQPAPPPEPERRPSLADQKREAGGTGAEPAPDQ